MYTKSRHPPPITALLSKSSMSWRQELSTFLNKDNCTLQGTTGLWILLFILFACLEITIIYCVSLNHHCNVLLTLWDILLLFLISYHRWRQSSFLSKNWLEIVPTIRQCTYFPHYIFTPINSWICHSYG